MMATEYVLNIVFDCLMSFVFSASHHVFVHPKFVKYLFIYFTEWTQVTAGHGLGQ